VLSVEPVQLSWPEVSEPVTVRFDGAVGGSVSKVPTGAFMSTPISAAVSARL
jgi:hypothetical protein